MPLSDMQHVEPRQSERPWTTSYEVGLREALPAVNELPHPMEELVRRLELMERQELHRVEMARRFRSPQPSSA
jgi:hypothetical protein